MWKFLASSELMGLFDLQSTKLFEIPVAIEYAIEVNMQ
jgi:hypothetical protein